MKKSLFSLLLSVCFLCALPSAYSQSYMMSDTLINTCSGLFLDSGGSEHSYAVNENITSTICSNDTTGTHIRLSFSSIDIGSGESFSVYDADTADPAALIDDTFLQTPHHPFVIQATAANTSGCLTIVFTSDDVDGNEAGWGASISCGTACQTILSALTTSTPAAMPADTGWIDICPGQEVSFAGHGLYPQNGTIYQHADTSVQFEWIFGDGHIAQGSNTSHVYETPGGYIVQLNITDQFGCSNTNSISQRVRVAPSTNFEIDENLENTFCLGDTIRISASVDSSATADLYASPQSASFQQTLSFSEPLVLPDGTGVRYIETLNFTNFPPGALVDDTNDISNVTLDMEHAYAGDLDIQLRCPNGNSIHFLDFPSGLGPTNFGEPFASGPVDNQSSDLTLGIPYTYVFTNDAANGTLVEFDAMAPTYTYTTVASDSTGNTYTYTDTYFPQGEYQPLQPFSNLLGCPLNGNWSIIVQDNLGSDNGWITAWSMTFADELYTNTETFEPTIIDLGWEDDPSILNNTGELLEAVVTQDDMVNYTFWAIDDFNCLSDTTLQFTVLPDAHPDCGGCDSLAIGQEHIAICEGSTYTAPSGASYSASGIYQDTISNAFGCDSLIDIHLNVGNLASFSIYPSICLGDTYSTPSGINLHTTGVYQDTISNSLGCDSIFTIHLNVTDSLYYNINESICAGDIYTAPSGANYSSTGIYQDTTISASDCYSIANIELNVLPVSAASIFPSICIGDSYTAPSGAIYQQPGTYLDTISNTLACDSIITIELALTPPIDIPGTMFINICEGESYTSSSGSMYTQEGFHQDTIINNEGCDSIRHIFIFVENNTLDISIIDGVLHASLGYDNYQWYSEEFGIIEGANSATFTPNTPGNYYYEVTTSNCTHTSESIEIMASSTSELAFESLAVYPSLTQGRVHISISDQEHFDNIKLVDLRGIELQEYASNTRSLDLSHFSAGMYFLVFEGEYKRSVVKVVKL